MDAAARFLADNLRQLRTARGLTQARVAAALQVSLEELLSPPRAAVRFFAKGSLPTRTRGDVVIQTLLPDALPGLQLERMELAPGTRFKGTPHVAGTREYLSCERGAVELVASGEVFKLSEGDAVVFRGDQAHTYRNAGSARAVAYSAVVLAAT